MRFPYRSYPVQGIGTKRYEVVHRPTVLIRMIGPSGEDSLPVLLDTGADDTLLPDILIGKLGVAITR